MTNFASDNVTGVAPEIMAALAEANKTTSAMPYGDDDWTARLQPLLSEIFEREVSVSPVISGTAANVLPISSLVPPFGAIYCHELAHINVDECGASEFYSGGAKLVPLAGENGKFSAESLAKAIFGKGVARYSQPALVSLTQTTEMGTLYRPQEVAAITAVAREQGLKVHMDGARFANAVAGLGCSPADITWRAGVDVLSLGATKNGAMGAEAIVFFTPPGDAAGLDHRRVRGGHYLSKMRYLSAQLEAYFTDGLWLRNAAHANAMAARLAEGLAALDGVALNGPVEANMLFATLPKAMARKLKEGGFEFYEYDDNDPVLIRMVTSFSTRSEDVEAFLALAAKSA